MTYTLWHGDCLEEMSRIEDGSIDAIIADLPYGTTACKWDVVIPFEPLWAHYKRVIKRNGAVVLFGSQPFTTLLIMSNLAWFKYELIWEKTCPTGFVHAKNKPLKYHENILIFSEGTTVHISQSVKRMTYNPQIEGGRPYKKTVKSLAQHTLHPPSTSNLSFIGITYGSSSRYPKSIVKVPNPRGVFTAHPTQKPVALLSYLIKTYTNEGDTVLDSTCGSGSTLEAAMRCKRNSIGIEKDAHYFSVAQQRLERVAAELRGELNHLPMFADNAQLP